MLKIGCDLCNTVADINTLVHAVSGIRDNSTYPLPLPKDFFASNPEIFQVAKPLKGAAQTLRHLANQGAKIHYITARPNWAREITLTWLKKNGFPEGELHMELPKRDVIKACDIHIMLEDSPVEITALADICKVLVRAQPYNQGYPNRFNNWWQVVNLLKMEVDNNVIGTRKEYCW